MRVEELDFWEYVLISDNGELIGIDEDAPEEAKKTFRQYLNINKKLNKQNVCGSLDYDAIQICLESMK